MSSGPKRKGICSMATIRTARAGRKQARARRVRVGSPDPRLTPCAAIEAVRELDRVLGIRAAVDHAIGPVTEWPERRAVAGVDGQLSAGRG